MSNSTIADQKSDYVKNIEKRQAQIAETVKKHSIKTFGHTKASIRDIRLEAIKRSLENTFAK